MQTRAAKLPLAAHSHSSDSGEMSSMSERKLCRNCVLLSERCSRLQYSLGKRSAKFKEAKQSGADEGAGGGDGGGHLGATNTCPEDSKELGSSDCMSAKHREGRGLGAEWVEGVGGSGIQAGRLFISRRHEREPRGAVPPWYSHCSCSITSLRSAWMKNSL